MKALKDVKPLYESKFLNFYSAEYEDKGKVSPYFFTSRHKKDDLTIFKNAEGKSITPNAIEAFTYIDNDDDKKIILIKEFRSPLNSWVYSFPAGLIENGEDYTSAILREVSEEIGGEVECVKLLQSYPLAMCAGLTDEANMLSLVKLKSLKEQHLDDGEYIEVVQLSPEELIDKLKFNSDFKLTASGYLGCIVILIKLGFDITDLL